MPTRVLFFLLLAGGAAYAAPDSRVSVIVELFTSEGCSSCPPADEVLARLERTQPIPGAHVIALSEHVDYWNNLGWVDPFSSPQFRARQNDYAYTFGVDSVYTPQMVVNGRAQFVGDDLNRAVTEIGRAATQTPATIRLNAVPSKTDPAVVDLMVDVTDLPALKVTGKKGPLVDVFLAVTEDNLTSRVQRGENSGRSLRHTAVVRSFGVIGAMDPREQPFVSLHPALKLPGAWKRADLKAVVFVQERSTRKILGAESVDLN